MARLNLTDAETTAAKNRPWTIRMEFNGPNPNNASGVSHKYWYATGRGPAEPIEAGWGAIGSAPQLQLIDWPELRRRVAVKLVEDYRWADTPYIRMSAGNIALLTGNPVPVAAVPVPKPVPVAPAPVLPAVRQVVNSPIPAASLALITALRMLRDGAKLIGYEALDAAGNLVVQMTPDVGLKFAQDYGVDIKFA